MDVETWARRLKAVRKAKPRSAWVHLDQSTCGLIVLDRGTGEHVGSVEGLVNENGLDSAEETLSLWAADECRRTGVQRCHRCPVHECGDNLGGKG